MGLRETPLFLLRRVSPQGERKFTNPVKIMYCGRVNPLKLNLTMIDSLNKLNLLHINKGKKF